MKSYKFIYILCIGLMTACAGAPKSGAKTASKHATVEDNSKKLLLLRLGMSKSDVIKILGSPDKTESYDLGNKASIEFYLYKTQMHIEEDIKGVDNQMIPLAFQNGKLIGWGKNYYEKILHHQRDIKENDVEFGTIPDFNIYEVEEFY